MKRLLILSIILLCASASYGQGTSSPNARRLRSGTASPNSPALPCVPGPPFTDIYIRTSDHSQWQCTTAPSTWTQVVSGGTPGTVTSVSGVANETDSTGGNTPAIGLVAVPKADNFVSGLATTATAAATTTLTVASKHYQVFTGSTTQTVALPDVTTLLQIGFSFDIQNDSSGVVTVNSSGGNLVKVMDANTRATFTCKLLTGTTAASWNVTYVGGSAGIGGSTGTTDNAALRADGTGGATLQSSGVTIDDSDNISTPGSFSTGVGGSVAGTLELTQGTAPSLGTTSVKLYAPTSVTSYAFVFPTTSATGFLLGTNAANVNTLSFVGSTGTGNVARADTPTFTTTIKTPAITVPSDGTSALTIYKADGSTVSGAWNTTGANLTFGGTAQVGIGIAGFAEFANTFGFGQAGKYGFIQDQNGASSINSASGQALSLRIGGTDKFIVDSSGNSNAIGSIINIGIATDATHTTSSVCQDTTTHTYLFGSGAAGICLGTSSARFKNHIRDSSEGLAQILQLRPRRFFYNVGYGDSGAHEQYGFIAGEMLKPLPGLVRNDAQGRPQSIDYMALVPVLVKAVQQQQAQISMLRNEVRRLKRWRHRR